jgi:hypothetical protein
VGQAAVATRVAARYGGRGAARCVGGDPGTQRVQIPQLEGCKPINWKVVAPMPTDQPLRVLVLFAAVGAGTQAVVRRGYSVGKLLRVNGVALQDTHTRTPSAAPQRIATTGHGPGRGTAAPPPAARHKTGDGKAAQGAGAN